MVRLLRPSSRAKLARSGSRRHAPHYCDPVAIHQHRKAFGLARSASLIGVLSSGVASTGLMAISEASVKWFSLIVLENDIVETTQAFNLQNDRLGRLENVKRRTQ
jgi:hypothetical protein